MISYILRRILLMIPTLFGILLLNFLIIHLAPGGPIERLLAQFTNYSNDPSIETTSTRYIGGQGLNPELVHELEVQFGFDKPLYERFFLMLKNYLSFNLGNSFFKDESVVSILIDRLPVSLSLGFWTTLLIYLVSIPLGVKKATQNHGRFDLWTSVFLVIAYAIPAFLLAILFIILFCGGSYWHFFPLRGLVSDQFETFTLFQKMTDYLWHITLPVIAMTLSGFASLTFLTKNSFLEEIHKNYVLTAYAKGLSRNQVLYGHVFRNAMLIVIAGFPQVLISILFTSSLLIEVIFSLDGLGLLGFEAAQNRDFPILFGSLYFFTLIGLILNLLGDLIYVWVDPRIHFGKHAH